MQVEMDQKNVNLIIFFTSLKVSDIFKTPAACINNFSSLAVIFPLIKITTSDTSVIHPIPPICISKIITTCPKIDQYENVSKTVSPVTHVALVAVNSESTKPVHSLDLEDIGKDKSPAPNKIKRKKLTAISLGAVKNLFNLFIISLIALSAKRPSFLLAITPCILLLLYHPKKNIATL